MMSYRRNMETEPLPTRRSLRPPLDEATIRRNELRAEKARTARGRRRQARKPKAWADNVSEAIARVVELVLTALFH